MATKSAYEKKMDAQLDEWRADIDKLKARPANASADSQIALERQIEDLERKRREAADKIAGIKAAGDDAFEELKSGFERAREDMSKALSRATDAVA